ncbi:hypothetical protein [Streptomyces sp. AC495_CC817]|uniref:hypothetical protein n=1 Tax=Streptomyces sp. AC495_CC817 TaxID=2823900 RepID=UPI001C279ADF|nr:hypothetical protein [Streptomyces sp. AC495_CC817]
MADPDSPRPGSHALPQVFSSSPPSRRRRPRARTVFLLAGTALLAAGFGAAQLVSNLGYDDASAQFRQQARATEETATTVRAAMEELDAATSSATQLAEGDTTLIDPATADSVASAVVAAQSVSDDTGDLLTTGIPRVGEKPGWFWELFAAADRLSSDRAETAQLQDDLDAQSPRVAEADTEVADAGLALLATAAEAATGFEASHISARNDAVIALRAAAADVASAAEVDETAVTDLRALQSAAAQVVSTEQEELAEKAGPLLDSRLEVEAFARSLAPGVLLEFDWSPMVSGAGDGGSMGGLTTWWWDSPGRAVIELSNSVAERWPSISSKALVAHEVGHAISVKCEDMYDSSTQDSIEKWATAWAISMGYTDDANGVWAYGYPPQSYIDAAAGCR